MTVKLLNYKPYFFLKIPDDWTTKFANQFIRKNFKLPHIDYTRPKNHFLTKKQKQSESYDKLEQIRERLTDYKNKSSLLSDDISIENEIF